jgi:CRISPR type III-associated protein (TIGR04423 family)
MNRSEVIKYINGLKGYEGYVQFSHRPIDMKKDIFIDKEPKVEDEKEGFVLEAHFFNGVDSVTIRQINSEWLVDENRAISLDDVHSYHGIESLELKMAQVWRAKKDKNCANMDVLKLEKVVFAGFKKEGEE